MRRSIYLFKRTFIGLSTLILGACATAIQAVDVEQAFQVSDPTIVKPVAITRVVAKMRRGTNIGTLQGGWACVSQGPIRWQSGSTVNFSSEELVDVFREELELNGWPVAGSTDDLFSGYDISGAELLIAAKIANIDVNLCVPNIGWGIYDSKGALRMDIDWQVYNPARREIIGEISTAGSFEIKRARPSAEYDLMAGAFAVAVNNLLASTEFRDTANRQNTLVSPDSHRAGVISIANNFRRFSSAQEATEYAQRATVTVRVANSSGSAFAIGDGSYFLTNAHVVGDAENVTVVTNGGLEIPARVIRKDNGRDVALLNIEGVRLPALHINSDGSSLASDVYAIGSPLGEQFQGSVTTGIVSSYRRTDGYRWLQSDTAINPGNSGGPLINQFGSVVGISTAGMSVAGGNDGLNLFVPIDDAFEFLSLAIMAPEGPE